MFRGEFQNYWSQTGSYESIVPLISMDFDSLKAAVITMLSGEQVKVKTKTYQNNKDDFMISLIHLRYLAYDQKNQTTFISNEEIHSESLDVVEENKDANQVYKDVLGDDRSYMQDPDTYNG